jgi:Zn-dependent protease with chaperone function
VNLPHLKLPPDPPNLAETAVDQCRHPREHAALGTALLTLATLVTGAVVFRHRQLAFALAGLWVSMILVTLQAATYNRLRGAEVTTTQFPEIHKLLVELRQRFDAPPINVFVVRSPLPEAHAYGFRAPYVVVLHSALLDSLDANELRYALGRQVGRIRFGHTRVALLLGGGQSTLPSILGWAGWLRDVLFAWYWRMQVVTADRCGVLGCASTGTAVRAEVKLSVGAAQLDEVRADDLLRQVYVLSQGLSRFQGSLIRLQCPTPPLIPRLQAMVEWAGMPDRNQSAADTSEPHPVSVDEPDAIRLP